MANLKELKGRINSVKSTQKITKAMKMVAAAKLRRAQEKAEAARPYSERMERMLAGLATSVKGSDSAPKLLAGNGRDRTHLLVVISSYRGLCGALNGAVARQVKRHIAKLQSEKRSVKILCIGKKGQELFKRDYSSLLVKLPDNLKEVARKGVSYEDAELIAAAIFKLFEMNEFDVCTLYYNKFQSAISQLVTAQQLIPLALEEGDVSTQGDMVPYLYEPSEEDVLNKLLPENFTVQLYHALLENAASEHGARMTAMDNATRNAGDMIKRLTLQYNRTRQAAITKELIEIISGAEAL